MFGVRVHQKFSVVVRMTRHYDVSRFRSSSPRRRRSCLEKLWLLFAVFYLPGSVGSCSFSLRNSCLCCSEGGRVSCFCSGPPPSHSRKRTFRSVNNFLGTSISLFYNLVSHFFCFLKSFFFFFSPGICFLCRVFLGI